MLRSDPRESLRSECGPSRDHPNVFPRIPERHEQVRRTAQKEGSEHGGVPGHRWKAEDGATGSGGCFGPFQPDEHVHVHAIGPPWCGVH